MRSIRGGMGLGDALYVQAIARYLVQRGERLKVCTAWPDVFGPLGDRVQIEGFRRANVSILAHYSLRKKQAATTQFQDCCIEAGISGPVELRLDWRPPQGRIVEGLREDGRPVLCVQLPRNPMGRTDGFGAELLPNCRKIQAAIDAARGRALIVQVGSGAPLFRFSGIDVDLANKTTVSELIDIAAAADLFLGYPSFLLPLAESLAKPVLMVFSSRGLESRTLYVRLITPRKLLHSASSRAVIDSDTDQKIGEAMHALL